MKRRFPRIEQLPAYVLGQVDDLKNALRAEGREIFDFGLGSPDLAPPRAVVDRLRADIEEPGFQRYMPSRGIPELRSAMSEWYRRRYAVEFDPQSEVVTTLGSKQGLADLFLAVLSPGESVLTPDPGYPIHHFGVLLAGANVVSYQVTPGGDHFKAIETALASAARPVGLVVNFPQNPTTEVVDLAFYAKVVDLARKADLWVVSDLCYADLTFDGKPAPSVFQVPGARELAVEFFTLSKSYSMPGWRVGACVGNRDLISALAVVKGYRDYGIFRPIQAAAVTALLECTADEPREQYRRRAAALVAGLRAAGWEIPMPKATMFVWARIPARFQSMGSVGFTSHLLSKAGVAVSPGTGFGAQGEGFVRFALVENEERIARACQAVARALQ